MQVGPLIRHWVMRYEAKHHFFKKTATVTGNYKNVAKTLAIRHQILQSMYLHSDDIIPVGVVVHEGFEVNLNVMLMGSEIVDLLKTSIATSCRSIMIFSTKYAVGDSVLIGFDGNGDAEIGQIAQIVVNSIKSVCFLLKIYYVLVTQSTSTRGTSGWLKMLILSQCCLSLCWIAKSLVSTDYFQLLKRKTFMLIFDTTAPLVEVRMKFKGEVWHKILKLRGGQLS